MKLNFEYRIIMAYLIVGALWIAFSDKALHSLVRDADALSDIQTYKGWLYVSITAFLFYLFLKKHLNRLRKTEHELEKHRINLQQLVEEKIGKLDMAIAELSATNEELNKKNEIINLQNTELKETLLRLKEAQSHLIQAEKMASLGILTAGVAHEINNPLNFILGGYTGLESYFEEEKMGKKEVALFMSSIKTGVDRASAIVSGLNQLSRSNESYDEDCDIHSIIENCLMIVNNDFKFRINVFRNFEAVDLVVKGNVGQLHQVFINILVNSGQSIEDKGSIFIITNRKEGKALITITDTGCGISPENLSRISDPFFTTKDPGKGTGLGLSIAYTIIQDHHGKISFQSELGKGTTVTITLPI